MRMGNGRVLLVAAAALASIPVATQAVGPAADETRFVVRAVSRGAKVMGDNVGGVRVTVRDPSSGEVLLTAVAARQHRQYAGHHDDATQGR